MLLKRFQAATLDEALALVRADCGDEALLVETRQTSKGVLVVAARQDQAALPPPRAERQWSSMAWTRGFAPLAELAQEFGLSPRILKAVEKALVGTKVELGRPGAPALPGLAARVLKALIPTHDLESNGHRVHALVGPTGVGKTTTLAKLAAQAVRDRGEDIAIITIDTYRVAAVEQLRAFADILQVPFEVAFTPTDLRRAVQQHRGADRIFIDTTGRSPFDDHALRTLRGTLDGCDPAVLLCMAAGSRRRDADATLDGFDTLNPLAAMITKWDETQVPGETLSALIERGLPLCHVTIGQEVPEDIVRACAGSLAAAAFSLSDDLAQRLITSS